MNNWNQFPLLRILFPFIAGIILSVIFPDSLNFSEIFTIIFCALTILAVLIFPKLFKHYNTRWVLGSLFTALVFMFACNLTVPRLVNNNAAHLKNLKGSSDTVIATIIDPVLERENSCKVILEIHALKKHGVWQSAEGTVMAYFQKDSIATELDYGDRLMIVSSFNEPKSIQNPGEFNYKRYLTMRSVFLQSYIKSDTWCLLERGKGNKLREFSLNIREIFLEIFRDFEIQGEEYAVAGALILGYTDKLDQDLMSIYSGSGAMHILSVSGMHVGVIFIVLNFLLSFLERSKKGRITKPVILILLIWFYAAITGLSPAVSRAATMISFVIAGKLLGRNTNIYNTLAASALLLLIVNPLLIGDVGFQLSYIAVLGIVILQRKIQRLWLPRNWFVTQVWLIVSVSLAAQIATFPLSLFYFHQFPNYFLLTNLIVVPFSNFIIYCGMLLLISSPLSPVAALLSKIFVYMLQGLNYSIRFVEGLPGSVTKGLTLTIPETLLLYVALAFMVSYIMSRRYRMLNLSMLFMLFFFLSLAFGRYDAIIQRKFIVYSIKKSTAIDFIQGKDHLFISDSLLLENSKALNMHVKNNWTELRLADPHVISCDQLKGSEYVYEDKALFVRSNIVQFNKKRLAIVSELNFLDVADTPLSVDYLLVSRNLRADIEELLDIYKPGLIIFDASNSLKKTEKWIAECSKLGIPCYSVVKSGAFVEEI